MFEKYTEKYDHFILVQVSNTTRRVLVHVTAFRPYLIINKSLLCVNLKPEKKNTEKNTKTQNNNENLHSQN